MRYRGPLGLVEAVEFVGREDIDLLTHDENLRVFDWAVEAFNNGTLERNAFHTSLVVHQDGGSVGMARGDWLLRLADGSLRVCTGERFRAEYRIEDDG